jgi:MFS family permease
MTPAAAPCPPLAFRGWAVVAGSFMVQALAFGAVYSFPAFAEPLQRSFGASKVSVSLVYAVSGSMAFGMGVVSGPLSDRFGARWPVSTGMAIMAAGFLLAAMARNFTEVLLCYGLLVGVGAGLSYVPAVAVVQQWFVAWRGLASGLATAGVGAGTAMVPISAEILARFGDWRSAFLIAGLSIAVLGLLSAQLLARWPEDCGLCPDGEVQPAAQTLALDSEGISLGEALCGSRFARLLMGTLFLSVAVALPFADIVTTARAAGIGSADALWLLSLIGIGSIIGRLALGAVADWFGRGRTMLACCFGVAAMMAWWAEAAGGVAFVVFALGFGFFQGGFVALLPSAVVDLYGRRSAGAVIGVLFAGRALAVLMGPPFVAAIGSARGHALPLWIVSAFALAGTLLLARALRSAGAPRREAERLSPVCPSS